MAHRHHRPAHRHAYRGLLAVLMLCSFLIITAKPATAGLDIVKTANSAIRAHQAGDRHEALALYTLVIDSNELNHGEHLLTYVYNNRGALWRDFGQYDKAIDDFTHAIDNRPDPVSYMSRGNTWVDLGDDRRAIEDYTASIRMRPDYARAYNNRAFAWLNLGQVDNAKADFARARQLDPSIENLTMD
ncbi:tetratricopeptide repeat protein [Oceanidesulfovibrio marinus]|uniref:Tetratricopeptide repeat protein n=1 Tax=Oceanidesulfovibrio marinus TaxID=370038 RepID=A0ABX6NB77_9BACT|nr:tetratricopeptide repeat protein [Oceanidesulfovibrio marinus]QJT07845.1 tetratricopeptide repeat protein [Oceanidesulfovibrio marinus]